MERIKIIASGTGAFIDRAEFILVNIVSVASVVVLDIYSEMPIELLWIIGLSIAFFNVARGISALRKWKVSKESKKEENKLNSNQEKQ